MRNTMILWEDEQGRRITIEGLVSGGRKESYGQPREYPEAEVLRAFYTETGEATPDALLEAAEDAVHEALLLQACQDAEDYYYGRAD